MGEKYYENLLVKDTTGSGSRCSSVDITSNLCILCFLFGKIQAFISEHVVQAVEKWLPTMLRAIN